MKKYLSALFFVLFVWGCANNKKEKEAEVVPEKETTKSTVDSTLITDSAWGVITKNTDFAGLQTIFGASNIKDERICGPECADSVDITKVYPDTKNEIIIYWKENLYHKTIGLMESGGPESPYHTAAGLKIGSTLNDILKINGQKISFTGFDWDYGGYIQSYNGGTLDPSSIQYRLELRENSDNTLSGDSEFNTDMPAVKKQLDNIVVYRLSLTFYDRDI